MKPHIFLFFIVWSYGLAHAQEPLPSVDSSYNSLSILNDYKISWPGFNRAYRYNAAGAGFTFSQWENHNQWMNTDVYPSFKFFIVRKFKPRLFLELSLQYLHAQAKYNSIHYKTKQLVFAPFAYFDFIQNRSLFRKRKDFIPFVVIGLSSFINLQTQRRVENQAFSNLPVPTIQLMIPAGMGLKYKLSKQVDLKISVLRYFNVSGGYSDNKKSLGNFNQIEFTVSYIKRVLTGVCPVFR